MLGSLPAGMRSLVVDHESTDGTAQAAQAFGATVIVRPFAGFVTERAFAVSQVVTPWTLMIDADEALDDRLQASIVACAGTFDCYVLSRTTFFCGKPMRLWRNEPLVRLFRTGHARLQAQAVTGAAVEVHERWICDAPASSLAGTLLHDSYPDVASYRRKFEVYTSLEAEGLPPEPRRAALALAAAPVRALWLLLGRGAAADGWRGAYVAWYSAYYPCAVHLKALRAR